jgi:hypothetical protein
MLLPFTVYPILLSKKKISARNIVSGNVVLVQPEERVSVGDGAGLGSLLPLLQAFKMSTKANKAGIMYFMLGIMR